MKKYFDKTSLIFSILIMIYVLIKEYIHVRYPVLSQWPPSMTYLPELLLYGFFAYMLLWKIKDLQKRIIRLNKDIDKLLDENDELKRNTKKQ